jgi:rhodanese-related sulfurtransferase
MNRHYTSLKKLSLAALATLGVSVAQSAEKPASQPDKPAAEAAVRHVNPEAAQKLVAEKGVVVLDIRTREEFKARHIAGATNINFRAPDFAKQIAALPKDKPYLLHCASGNRSTQLLPVFKQHDFKSLYHLDGGMKAWEKAGLPVTK